LKKEAPRAGRKREGSAVRNKESIMKLNRILATGLAVALAFFT
jgi:hypothetical protein